jgi:hypothetical protein
MFVSTDNLAMFAWSLRGDKIVIRSMEEIRIEILRELNVVRRGVR